MKALSINLVLNVVFILSLTLLNFGLLNAQDGLFSDGRSLKSGNAEIGLQPVFLTESDDFMFFVRGRYGLKDHRDVSVKLGLLGSEMYLGMHVEEPFLVSKKYNLTTYFQYGAQYWGDLGLKASYNIRLRLDGMNIYTGLMYQPFFGEVIIHPLIIPLGLSFKPEGFNGQLFFEANGGLNNDATAFQSVQFGFKIPIN